MLPGLKPSVMTDELSTAFLIGLGIGWVVGSLLFGVALCSH